MTVGAFRVAIAQVHSPTGAYEHATAAVGAAIEAAQEHRADLLITPALLLPGAHARDANRDASHLHAAASAAEALIADSGDSLVVAVGVAKASPAGPVSALAVGSRDTVLHVGASLPVHGLGADPASTSRTLVLNGVPVALSVGWPSESDRQAFDPRTKVLVIADAEPYRDGGPAARERAVLSLARTDGLTVVYVNAVGGHDGLVYPGGALVATAEGKVLTRAPLFTDGTHLVDIPVGDIPGRTPRLPGPDGHPTPRMKPTITSAISGDAEVYAALVRGLRDYVHDNGFSDVFLGLSGGIDSALVACLAVDAFGATHVHGIAMPGPHSSPGSVTDAAALADALGVRMDTVAITDVYEAEMAALGALADGPGAQVASENVQSRLRALHLMTVANASNSLLLNTGNKSEAAVGYFTLGGDGMGAIAPLADLVKGRVYDLSRWRNRAAEAREETPPIPQSTLTKAPSAELAPDQQDSDSLPPYDVLDLIVTHLTERRASAAEVVSALVDAGHAKADAQAAVDRVRTLMVRTEHKRKVCPPGIRVTSGAFGHDLNAPTTARLAPS